jgi:phosphoglucosamine mutase
MADEKGNRIDGDQLMGLVATTWAKAGKLKNNTLVSTVMSNLGLERHLEKNNIKMLRTSVGDRYVVEAMREKGCNVGGEQSGHIIFSDYGATGDGLVAALQILSVIGEKGHKASEVCSVFKTVPQVLTNVRADGEVLKHSAVLAAIDAAEKKLGKTGRLVIRKSGTEPLVRVMAEGDNADLVQKIVAEICDAIKKSA